MRERGIQLVPVGAAREDERVQPSQQAQRRVPRQLSDERRHVLVLGEAAAEIDIERRAPLAVRGLPPEDLRLAGLGQAALEDSCAALA